MAQRIEESSPAPLIPLDGFNAYSDLDHPIPQTSDVVTNFDIRTGILSSIPVSKFAKNGHLDLPLQRHASRAIPTIENDYINPEAQPTTDFGLFRMVPLAELGTITDQVHEMIKENEIHASAGGQFPRPFGRDSYITAFGLLEAYKWFPEDEDQQRLPKLLNAIKGMYRFLASRDFPAAGVEKGKQAHEVGTIDQKYPKEFYINEYGMGENYDSLEATDWGILTADRLLKLDPSIEAEILDRVKEMTEWTIRNTEEHAGPGYIGASYDPRRYYPGLHDQGWRDGEATTMKNDGTTPTHPIYRVFEGALRWSALSHAAQMLAEKNPKLSTQAKDTAAYVKSWFNENFLYEDAEGVYLAESLDAYHNKITPITIDSLLALLPSFEGEKIIDDPYIRRDIIRRAQKELFDPRGGLYTVSKGSFVHPKNTYQNHEAIWPHASAMAVIALENEARTVELDDPELSQEHRENALKTGKAAAAGLLYWQSTLETFQIKGNQLVYYFHDGGTQCKQQAWTGGTMEYVYRSLKAQGVTEIPVPVASLNTLNAD